MPADSAYENSLSFARAQDAADPLAELRHAFHLPTHGPQQRPAIYLCGNSLGLAPRAAAAAVRQELDRWAQMGVEGHFRGESPWLRYHQTLADPLARLVGAAPDEVVAMNALTVNLHLLLVSFYRPSAERYRVLMEAGAFPSDQYAVASQVQWHGHPPSDAIVTIGPRPGEDLLRTADVVAAIERAGPTLALVMLGGVNYYSGQFYDLAAIAAAAHRVGATVGFDLAHAVGNVPLHLHEWNVDFAAWCSYKYLNAGPGGVAGAFVHARHARSFDRPRLAGWWGHEEATRFQMEDTFRPAPGAEGWQLSNAPVLSMAVQRAALALFDAAGGMAPLRKKSERLTGYLAFLIGNRRPTVPLHVITPADPSARGCQLSLRVPAGGRALYDRLTRAGAVVDWREPDVLRAAPVPLYNTFEEVWRFAALLAGEDAPG